jgi:UDP:flavonoid glycosyltransferase YjiC (YdhE family)
MLGPRSLRASIESQGIGYAELGVVPPADPAMRPAYLLEVAGGSSAMADDLRRLAGALQADALLVDCNLAWALENRVSIPSGVLVHTALGLYLPVWQAVVDALNRQRVAGGLPILAPAAEAWATGDRLLVASLAHFDRPVRSSDLHATYVGPVASPRAMSSGEPPAIVGAADRPLVLISYSTEGLQNAPRRVQTALDALADLPVRVIATTSGVFPVSQLRVAANATVVDYLPHAGLMSRVSLVVCHAGHGTTMAALTSGVPLVCVPGLGRDQAPIAARVSDLGLGIALSSDATGEVIGHAVARIVGDDRYRLRARAFMREAPDVDGGLRAAIEIEDMLAGSG